MLFGMFVFVLLLSPWFVSFVYGVSTQGLWQSRGQPNMKKIKIQVQSTLKAIAKIYRCEAIDFIDKPQYILEVHCKERCFKFPCGALQLWPSRMVWFGN